MESLLLSYARSLAGPRRLEVEVHGAGGDAYDFASLPDGGLRICAGSERGVLYAIQDASGGRKAGSSTPRFAIRGINVCETLARHSPEQVRTLIGRLGRWRFNRLIVHPRYGFARHRAIILEECARRGIEVVYYTYDNLTFGAAVPSDFHARSADGGLRFPHMACETRLCASSAEGLARYRAAIRPALDAHPDERHLIFATADGLHLCQCPTCRDKDAVAQWRPFFDAFMAESAGLRRELVAYNARYTPPADLDGVRRLDAVMFDTFPRDPRAGIGEASSLTPADLGGTGGSTGSASTGPVNIFLHQRLRDWRRAFPGQLYVFEDLMIQAILGQPRPNLAVYLRDLDLYQAEGLAGVVYECYEPGIVDFLPHLDHLALAMWGEAPEHVPGPFERAYLAAAGGDHEWMWVGHDRWAGFTDQHPGMRLCQLSYRERRETSVAAARDLLEHVLASPDRERLDWLYIGFGALRRLHLRGLLPGADADERRFLGGAKLWDYQELAVAPHATAGALIERLARQLGADFPRQPEGACS